jgi:hypothetical protein
VVEAQISQVRSDGRATSHRSGLHRTELCWRIGGEAAAAKSREGDGGGGEEESKGGGGEGEGRDGSEVRVRAPGWGGGIRLGSEWREGAFVKMARSVLVK